MPFLGAPAPPLEGPAGHKLEVREIPLAANGLTMVQGIPSVRKPVMISKGFKSSDSDAAVAARSNTIKMAAQLEAQQECEPTQTRPDSFHDHMGLADFGLGWISLPYSGDKDRSTPYDEDVEENSLDVMCHWNGLAQTKVLFFPALQSYAVLAPQLMSYGAHPWANTIPKELWATTEDYFSPRFRAMSEGRPILNK